MMKFVYNMFTIVAISSLWFTFSGNSSGAARSGSLTRTGASFDGGSCANCHGGSNYGAVTTIAVFETGTSTVVNNYVGGRTYDVRLLISTTTSPQRYGFQLVAANPSGAQAGSWSNFPAGTTGTNLSNRTYVEQTTPQSVNNFTFRWTAPATSFGTVTFYAAGNCVNNNGGINGDEVATGTLALPAQSCTLGTPTAMVTNASCPNSTNGSVNLSVSGGNLPYTFAWSNSATTQNLTNVAAGTYSVTVTDATNCRTIASGITVNANVTPNATITPLGLLTFCQGDSVLLGASGGDTYAWSNGGNTASINVKTSGTYTVTVTSSAGCTATASRTVTVNPNPVVTATATASGTGSTGTATASALGGTAPYTYAWTGARTGASLTGLAPGTYTVTASDVNGCKSTKSVVVENHTGLESVKDILLFEARPTLSDGHFALYMDLKSEQNVRLETFNMMGQMIDNQWIRGKNIVESLDWSHLSAGKYKLKVHTAEGVATCWIVIIK
jgi:hypothetical protein